MNRKNVITNGVKLKNNIKICVARNLKKEITRSFLTYQGIRVEKEIRNDLFQFAEIWKRNVGMPQISQLLIFSEM